MTPNTQTSGTITKLGASTCRQPGIPPPAHRALWWQSLIRASPAIASSLGAPSQAMISSARAPSEMTAMDVTATPVTPVIGLQPMNAAMAMLPPIAPGMAHTPLGRLAQPGITVQGSAALTGTRKSCQCVPLGNAVATVQTSPTR